MKIYEKPMATIEKIDVKDVITTSALNTTENATAVTALKDATGAANTIVFEW